jgi:hypothetical protein
MISDNTATPMATVMPGAGRVDKSQICEKSSDLESGGARARIDERAARRRQRKRPLSRQGFAPRARVV